MEKTTIEQLRIKAKKERLALNKTINKIDKMEEAEGLPELEKKYLGKYFKTRNSYGSGKKWWVYTKVESISFPNSFKGKTFQTVCDGKREIDFNYNGYLTSLDAEISKSEYTKQLEMIKCFINERLNP